MRKHVMTVAALFVVGLLAGQALAQADDAGGRRQRGQRGDRAGRAKARFDKLIVDLKLTDKQDAPVRQILQTYQADLAAWTRQNGPTMRELQQKAGRGRGRPGRNRQAGADAPKPAEAPNAEEVKAAREKLRELTQQRQAKTQNALTQLKEHLTAEQMTVAERALAPQRGRRGVNMAALRQLDLTKEQQAKVKSIMDAAREAGKDKQGPARGEAMQAAWDEIVKEVLTDAQREKLKALPPQGGRRGGGGFAGLDLTDKQQQQVDEIMKAAREKAGSGDREARRAAMTEARKKIAEEVLTPEQREKMTQRRAERGNRGGRNRRSE